MLNVLSWAETQMEVQDSSHLNFIALLLREDALDSVRGTSDSLCAVAGSSHPIKIC